MQGHLHPITILNNEIADIFTKMGFNIVDDRELEDEFHNFDALNIPKDHPARDMQDTFWVKGGGVLRTHTSSVQIREMERWVKAGGAAKGNTLAICVPGKVFRNEATDATHEAQFHQVEGLCIGEGITLANMKGVLEEFFSKLFGNDLKIRLRSSYFAFVEPGVEVDMQCFKCVGAGCNVCKQSGWIEIMGAGMVHPKVLENSGVDSRIFQGFAFGGGVDRLAMLRWGIDDVRLLYNGDLRVVNQF